MKRPPTVQHLSEQRNDVPKKRKIQPVFLGALGSAFTHQSELSAATSSVDPPQSQALVSETALHLNPGLIDRVSSSNEFTDHQQRASSPAIKAELEAGEEHSMLSNYSLLNSTIESSIVERQQQPALLTELRPLPELRPQNEAQVPSLSQAVDVHNLANATLPGPQPQKTFAIPIPMGATCQTDQIVAKNSLNNKRGVKYAKIQAFFGREQRWAHTISSPFLLLRANRSWVISTHEDNSLVVFCTRTGKVRFCLHTDWPTAILTIREDTCSALDTQAQLSTWDLRTCTRILHTSIKTLLIGCPTGTLQIVQLCLSANGVPLLVLSNGDVFVFSRSLASWLSLNMAKSFLLAQLPSLQFIAQWQPGGLISILSDALKSDKLVDSRPCVQSEEADSANEEAQLELLARAAIELHSPGEYRLLVAVYLQRLLKRQKVDKMAEYLTELRAIPNSPVPLETIIADIRPFLESTGLTVDALFCARGPWRQRELEASLALLT